MTIQTKKVQVEQYDFRVPKRGDLYLDKNNLIQRCREDRVSKHAQPRIILKELLINE